MIKRETAASRDLQQPVVSTSVATLKPYYCEDGITIYLGDCRDVLPLVDTRGCLLATDPPYSSGGFQESGKRSGSIGTRSDETIAADNLSTRGYRRLLREVLKATEPDEAFVFTDWKMWTHTCDSLEDAWLCIRNMIVWDKQQMGMGMPWRNQHELVAYAKRTPAKIMDGKRGNVIGHKRTGNEFHPTEKPVGLMTRLIGNTESETVVDPFMGSGTTLVACKLEGKQAIGVEVTESFCETAANRLSQGVLF